MGGRQRLDKVLSHMGFGSRKEVRQLIKQKIVYVNDEVAQHSGQHIDPWHDDIRVDDEHVVYRQFIYVMLNKPQGVISATEDRHERTVLDLLDDELIHFKPFPVGRLDKDTEGLLLLTNDGQLAHDLLSPKKEVPKTYDVEVTGALTDADVEAFTTGITLDDGYVTKPAKLEIISSDDLSKAYVTIVEGKFHQVKRMFASLGKRVTYLKRVEMGPLQLDRSLPLGHYRELTSAEVEQLKKA